MKYLINEDNCYILLQTLFCISFFYKINNNKEKKKKKHSPCAVLKNTLNHFKVVHHWGKKQEEMKKKSSKDFLPKRVWCPHCFQCEQMKNWIFFLSLLKI